ncbi:MAG TPA: cytochrome c oxidase subunit II [Burkholderiales bacterium]|nr:cytochrome c oxidase subunit II [Burkholderiales bacterium]
MALLFSSVYAGAAQSAYELNLQPPETPIAHQIYDLHTLILLVCVFIFCVVFGVMFYAIFKHRKSVGHKAAQFHENTTIEIIWTIIPFFILVGMAYPATKTVLAMKNTSNPDMTIKITGYQWKWKYDYLQDGIGFYSMLATTQDQIYGRAPKDEHYLLEVDKPLVVPTGKKIRLLITADDVIHSWWVPAFGVKQDAIVGFIRDTWFEVEKPGIYRGQCAELCGKDHGFMPIVVEAKEPKDYEIWLAEQKQAQAATKVDVNKTFTLDELKAQGEKVFNTTCAACHQVNGKGIPGTFPALDGSKIANGPKADHLNIVMNGKPGTAMVAFSTQLSDIELASVITYERNAWGNKTGDAIQPSEVKALRK